MAGTETTQKMFQLKDAGLLFFVKTKFFVDACEKVHGINDFKKFRMKMIVIIILVIPDGQ